jgi:DNA-directed RNA polymerase
MFWIKAGAMVALIAAVFWWHQTQVNNAADAARLGERLIWQERQGRQLIEDEAKRQSTHALIKSVEAGYWKQKAEADELHRNEMAALEQTLAEEKADDAKTDPAVCRPFVSKRVRDQINRLGSDPSGNHP